MSRSDDIVVGLNRGVAAHRSGRLAEAEAAYREVLRHDPRNADALNLLGMLSMAAGRASEAVELYDKAIAVTPRQPDFHFNRANALHATGNVNDAIFSYRRALELDPGHFDANLNLGVAFAEGGRRPKAIEIFQSMTKVASPDVRVFFNLGNALAREGRFDEAVATLLKALKVAPESVEVRIELADAYAGLCDYAAAVAQLKEVLRLQPRSVHAHDRLAPLLAKSNFPEEAIAAFQDAIEAARLDADSARIASRRIALGDVYKTLGRWTAAIAAYEQAVLADGQSSVAVHKVSEALGERDWLISAAVIAEGAAELKPRDHRFIHNLGLLELKQGRLSSGWEKYESRFKGIGLSEPYAALRWAGQDLAGRRIHVWPEQGLGEQILFSSLLSYVVDRAGKVYLEVEERLTEIMRRSFPQAVVIAGRGDGKATIPEPVDFQSPIGSLARFLRHDLQAFPKHTGYLKADDLRVEALRERYRALAAGRRIVGVSWLSKNERLGPSKSMALKDFKDVLQIPGVMFVSLQYGDVAQELADVRDELGVDILHDAMVDPLRDVDASFAQIAAVDLVLSTSNTTIHTAGALGKPAWLLLPKGGGSLWYWFKDQGNSPWYPSLRLFRQKEFTDSDPWHREVASRAAAALKDWVASGVGPQASASATPAASFDAEISKGIAFSNEGRLVDAAACFANALALRPNSGEVAAQLGELQIALQRFTVAAETLRRATELLPNAAEVSNNLGCALKEIGAFDEAEKALLRAISLRPNLSDAWLNLGSVHQLQGRLDDAMADYERTLAIGGKRAAALYNMASAVDAKGDQDRAIDLLNKALAEQPGFADAKRNRALIRLTRGEFKDGWTDYEGRWNCADFAGRYRPVTQPPWNGDRNLGGALLVWGEQGIGDELLYGTMVRDLVESQMRVIWEVDPRLVPLVARSCPQIQAVARRVPPDAATSAPGIVSQCPVGSLGQFLRPDRASFPSGRGAYLRADRPRVAALRGKLMKDADAGERLVGISWSSKNSQVGVHKSTPLTAWRPILKAPGLRFVDLQYGDTVRERAEAEQRLGFKLHHLDEIDLFNDLDGLAALVSACDLVISVSNTTVHLAGAIDVPAWVLVPLRAGKLWYWGNSGTASLWYDSVTLFRQSTPGRWGDVFDEVAQRLPAVASRHPA